MIRQFASEVIITKVFYNVAHDGLLLRAIAHRYHYHKDDYAVFLVNTKLYNGLDVNALENSRFIHMNMNKFAMAEGEFLEDRIVRHVKYILSQFKINIKDFDEIYALVDEVDLFGIYCEVDRRPYVLIEPEANICFLKQRVTAPTLEVLRNSTFFARSFDYRILTAKHSSVSGCGFSCKYTIYCVATTKFQTSVDTVDDIIRWDYKGILAEMSLSFLQKVSILFKYPVLAENSNKQIALIAFASRLIFTQDTFIWKRDLSYKSVFDSQFILCYLLIADLFAFTMNSEKTNVFFKPHPRESQFDFLPYIENEKFIPPLFPTELFGYSKHFKIKYLVSTTSSTGDLFSDSSRTETILLGTNWYEFYPFLIKFLVVSEILKVSHTDTLKIFISGISVEVPQLILNKQSSHEADFEYLRLFKDVLAEDNTLLILHSMIDKDFKRLKNILKSNSVNLTVIFLCCENFIGIINDPDIKRYITPVVLTKKSSADYCLANLEDEVICVFQKDTILFEDISNFNCNAELTYSKVSLSAQSSTVDISLLLNNPNTEVVSFKSDINNNTENGTENTNNKEEGKKTMAEKKMAKFREDGVPLTPGVDYTTRIENGVIRTELTRLPSDVAVGFELLFNMRVVDNLPPSYVTVASFNLKNFGEYSVRVRFYKVQNLIASVYRYDTAPMTFTLSEVIRTMNPESGEFNDALGTLERLLFDESQHNKNTVNILSMTNLENTLGYTFADYLIAQGINELYFYCDERDWGLGQSIYHKLCNDKRVSIKQCISELSYNGEVPKGLHQNVRFSPVNSYFYDPGETVLVVSATTQPAAYHILRSLRLNVLEMSDVIEKTLIFGQQVFPFIDFKLRYPETDLIFVKRPLNFTRINKNERSSNENDIIAKKVNIKTITSWIKQNPPVIPPALLDCAVTPEEVREFLAYTLDLSDANNGFAKLAERRGELVTTTNGFRTTTNQPDKFDNTIYFYGFRTIYSPFTSDSKTAASFLQRKINHNSNVRYKVENRGGYMKPTLGNMFNTMLAESYKAGDKVIVMLDYLPESDGLEYKIFDLENLFFRPHDYGEIWVDIDLNTNETGQRVIADAIFENLLLNGMLEKSDDGVNVADEKLDSDILSSAPLDVTTKPKRGRKKKI